MTIEKGNFDRGQVGVGPESTENPQIALQELIVQNPDFTPIYLALATNFMELIGETRLQEDEVRFILIKLGESDSIEKAVAALKDYQRKGLDVSSYKGIVKPTDTAGEDQIPRYHMTLRPDEFAPGLIGPEGSQDIGERPEPIGPDSNTNLSA